MTMTTAKYRMLAFEQAEKKNYAEAAENYKNALEAYPQDAIGELSIADKTYLKQRYEDMIQAAKELNQLTQSEKIRLGKKEIAKRIRTQLNNEFPHCVFSVRKETYSGGGSITISLMEASFKVIKDFKDIPQEVIEQKVLDRYTPEQIKARQLEKYHQLNPHQFRDKYDASSWSNGIFLTEQGHELFKKVVRIADQYNYDNSDLITDYFDVNFYLHLELGQYNKEFVDGV